MATALVDIFGTEPANFDRIILPSGYHPSDDEEFMCPRHRAYFLIAQDWKEAVVEEIACDHGPAPDRRLRDRHRRTARRAETDWSIELRTAIASAS